MTMTASGLFRLRRPLLALAAAVATGACGERVSGPIDHVGQLRVQPAFAAGDAPDARGVAVDSMRVEVRRGVSGKVHSDTVLDYDAATVLSWILQLESESEPVDVRLSLLSAADTLYAGARQLEVRTGTIGSAPLEAIAVLFQGDPTPIEPPEPPIEPPEPPIEPPAPHVVSVALDPIGTMLVGPDATTQLVATAVDNEGNLVTDASFVWSSSNDLIAAVDATGRVTAVSRGRVTISAVTDGVSGASEIVVATLDSTTYSFDETIIDDAVDTQKSLGTFVIPEHVPELGVEVLVDVLLSGETQKDEAFAVGVAGADAVSFIGDAACPVVADDPDLGRGWMRVGAAELAAGEWEFVGRHATGFACYAPLGGLVGPNSVHFWGMRFVYYRVD